MNSMKIVGLILAVLSCVPIGFGLRALDAGDPLGAGLGLAMAWVTARAAVELTAGAQGVALPGKEE
ncbi:MAG: hypothetical protein KC502_00725 [Myxococcales bacterium]|nr:hypothetical protein [Myxococcales bacterium]